MKFDLGGFSALLAAFAPLLALMLALAIDRRNRKHTEKPPQTEKLLRPPGYSLDIRLDETVDKILQDIFTACALSALAGASVVCVAQFLAAHVPPVALLVSVLILAVFVVAGIVAALRAFRRCREAQNIRLGLRGEQAVAESLNEVADAGFRSFHDLPGGDNWNIDHVTVGARGVFLIETKGRRRRRSRNGQPEHVVMYDGESLQFPTGNDANAIAQAKRNAKWLSDFLTKKTGERVEVNPLVVLPGWFVVPKGNFPVKVMNATYLAKFLRAQSESIRDAAQVRRIIAALDEKCRDVEF
jgi:hypothetical protein